jgi:hypothetical protein
MTAAIIMNTNSNSFPVALLRVLAVSMPGLKRGQVRRSRTTVEYPVQYVIATPCHRVYHGSSRHLVYSDIGRGHNCVWGSETSMPGIIGHIVRLHGN